MNFINKFKSPNFSSRKGKKILYVIIHYTALKNYKEAISYLCDVRNKVSSHYLISQKGEIFNLVKENKRAWHAGLSYWSGYNDINSISIGIELDFSKNKQNSNFTVKMLNSLEILLNKLKSKYKIKEENILGHSDIAPFRKKDPGPKFPWKKITKVHKNISEIKKNNFQINLFKKWLDKNNIISNKQKAIFILGCIGYQTKLANKKNYYFKKLLIAYQSHFVQNNVTGKIDSATLNYLLIHFLRNSLTKNKKNLLAKLMMR